MLKLITIVNLLATNYFAEPDMNAMLDAFKWASSEYSCVYEGVNLDCEFICAQTNEWLSKSETILSIPKCEEYLNG